RLSVAVVVNYRSTEDGPEPLPAEDLAKLNQLVKHAMGYSAERGDTLSVVNSQFNETVPESLPLWKNPTYIDHALGAAKYLLVLLVVYLLWQKIGQPLMENVISASIKAQEEEEKSAEPESAADKQEAAERLARELSRHEEN